MKPLFFAAVVSIPNLVGLSSAFAQSTQTVTGEISRASFQQDKILFDINSDASTCVPGYQYKIEGTLFETVEDIVIDFAESEKTVSVEYTGVGCNKSVSNIQISS